MEREREKMGSNGGGEEGRDGSECTQKDRIKRYLRKLSVQPLKIEADILKKCF